MSQCVTPSPDLLAVRPASPPVNSVKNEGPELLEDLSLFGRKGEEHPVSGRLHGKPDCGPYPSC